MREPYKRDKWQETWFPRFFFYTTTNLASPGTGARPKTEGPMVYNRAQRTMRRKLLLWVAVLLLANVALAQTHYDFSAVAPSGQTLYYKIVGSTVVLVGEHYIDFGVYAYSTPISGELVIPETVYHNGAAYSVSSISYGAFSNKRDDFRLRELYPPNTITSVVIPSTVTIIGSEAFYGCSSLVAVTIPSSVTEIGGSCFENCSGLSQVSLSATISEVPARLFGGCISLSTLSLPNSITSIGGRAFFMCTNLNAIDLPVSLATIGGGAFERCESLNRVDLPVSVTSIGGSAFHGCVNLASIHIPAAVTSIGDAAFSECSSLTSMTVASGNTVYDSRNNCNAIMETATNKLLFGCSTTTIHSSTDIIGNGAFWRCTNLIQMPIPNGVSRIEYGAFYECENLLSITIPNSVLEIGQHAFAGCKRLVSATLPSSITKIADDLFWRDSALVSMVIPNTVTTIGQSAFGSCFALRSVLIPSSVTKICMGAFGGCCSLSSVNIPNSVDTIEYGAFNDCTGPVSITIPNSVSSIGENAFSNVNNIVYHGTATGAPWNAKTMNGYVDDGFVYSDATKTLLTGCSSLIVDAVIPNTVISIKEQAFMKNHSLVSVVIPNSVENIGFWAFYMCRNLRSVSFGTSIRNLGDGAFQYCSSLESIALPNNLDTIQIGTFYGCRNLRNVTLGDSVRTIGFQAFSGCESLSEISFPNSVHMIEGQAFYGCGLISVRIGSNVEVIGDEAFNFCYKLREVTIPESVISIGDLAFANCDSLCIINYNARSCVVPVPSYGYGSVWNISGGANHIKRLNIGDAVLVLPSLLFNSVEIDTICAHAMEPPIVVDSTSFLMFSRTIPLYVPCQSVELYRNAPYWREFNVICDENIGIDALEAKKVKVDAKDSYIVVEGAMQESVSVYDMMGRMACQWRGDGARRVKKGIYLVRIGESSARKVVVM